jgi:hypothetical protein
MLSDFGGLWENSEGMLNYASCLLFGMYMTCYRVKLGK